jgi:ABC-2 type transport system permease protein
MMNANVAIALDNVVKKFPQTTDSSLALSHVSANIRRGTITGLVGADGSGKTTLLRLIAGLLTLTEGNISVEGVDPMQDLTQLRAIVGYMPQKFGLYEDLTVIENLVLYADLRGVLGQEREQVFEQLLNFTDLKRFVDRRAGNLSGGMKQKLGLACALLGDPKVLLLDEPSVGVDPISRRELWKMVNTLVKEGMTVLWSTSYLYEAEQCHDVLALNKGELIYVGEPGVLTAKMQGRSIQIQNIQGNHRMVLQHAMRSDAVIDGIIQGSAVRLVLKEAGKFPDLNAIQAGPNAKLVVVPPRFEDAYVELVGGVPSEFKSLLCHPREVGNDRDSEIVIEADNLTRKFDSFVAADHISFQVKRGQIFCLLGPNGAGKSTTFKMMCGLLTPTSGQATLLGIDLQKHPHQARQQLGYMAQNFSLYSDLTVQQNLQFFSGIYGLSGKTQNDIIARMLDVFDLHPFLNTKSKELSLGFKQRLALACAIMHNPAILFLDEPTSGVDPVARREFWAHINELVEQGVTVVVTTHFMDEAEYCDQIGLIYRGKMIAMGTPDQLKQLAVSEEHPDPTMEETFFDLIMKHDHDNQVASNSEQTAKQKEILPLREKAQSLVAKLFHDVIGAERIQQFNRGQHGQFLRRLLALCRKETYQIVRDPSSILVAFILPLVLLFIYGFGINLDTAKLRLGMVMNDRSPEAMRFAETYADSPYIAAIPMHDMNQARAALTAGDIRGIVTIQSDFTKRLKAVDGVAPVQILTDGSEPNTANFVIGYASGTWQTWLNIRAIENAQPLFNRIDVVPRYWFNPAAISRHFLVPGSIALVMTIIGALLTSLVVAREWERGTMEALLSTPITRLEFLYSKLIPYYLLGVIAMVVCTLAAVTILRTPFRGSLILLFIETSLFLGSVLGLGLLLSTAIRNQFNAAQAALNIAYLPATLLSGFVFEISSMPVIVQGITYIFPARYFVSSLQTLFLAGNVIELLVKNALFLLAVTLLFLIITYKVTPQRLD